MGYLLAMLMIGLLSVMAHLFAVRRWRLGWPPLVTWWTVLVVLWAAGLAATFIAWGFGHSSPWWLAPMRVLSWAVVLAPPVAVGGLAGALIARTMVRPD